MSADSRICTYPLGCTAPAVWIAEAGEPPRKVPLCDEHRQALIEIAVRNFFDTDPAIIRSAMERASYPIESRR